MYLKSLCTYHVSQVLKKPLENGPVSKNVYGISFYGRIKIGLKWFMRPLISAHVLPFD